jgi:murein DD-endopeptidase MepM/ murein hydrolase activator NlpD
LVLAHKKHKKKILNILLIPDDESSPKGFKIRYSLLVALLLLLIFVFVGLIIGSVTYGSLLQKAYENISLKQKNEQLGQQLQKMNELSNEVDNLKGLGRKVRNSMTGYVNLSTDVEGDAMVSEQGKSSDQSLISIFNSVPVKAPVNGFISQEYKQNLHNGIDIVASEGTPVVAAGSGKVLFSGWTLDGGNTIIIGHGEGYYSYYKHNLRNLVYENQNVEQGEVIAYLGNSGQKSFGPHLHFEIWKDGISIDPRTLILDYNK